MKKLLKGSDFFHFIQYAFTEYFKNFINFSTPVEKNVDNSEFPTVWYVKKLLLYNQAIKYSSFFDIKKLLFIC